MARIKYYDYSTGTVQYADTTDFGIDDSTVELNKTWSSQKINQMIRNESKIYSDTVEGWGSKPTTVSEKNAVYIYTDALESDGTYIPRIKIGDGSSYVVDLPFLNKLEIDHINNTAIHVSFDDRLNWDGKIRVYEHGNETVVFTID